MRSTFSSAVRQKTTLIQFFTISEKEGIPIKKQKELPWQIYDRIFKRIFSLSNTAIINLINGLFDEDFPPDSKVAYPNKESVDANLQSHYADVIIVINDIHTYHLEAQTSKEGNIILRVFEYSFQHAISLNTAKDVLKFPEPVVIYLNKIDGIPEESVLHIMFGSQDVYDYRVKNFVYLSHNIDELNQKRMVVLIPFQVMRLRSLIEEMIPSKPNHSKRRRANIALDIAKINRLQEEIRTDIMRSINMNLELGNITYDDSRQLLELTDMLYQRIRTDMKKKVKTGGLKDMNPLLPGAIELPNDKYRFRIDELEKENARYADENAKYADENARYADENARYADENARYADENARYADEIIMYTNEIQALKKRIAELESQ